MGRKGRIVLGCGLLGLGAWSVVPGMLHPISTDAVVNAEVVTIRAPVDGRLYTGQGLGVGDRVEQGEALAHVRADRPETGRRDGLSLELAAQRQLAEALGAEDRELAALDGELARRGAAYGKVQQQRLTHARTEAEAELRSARADSARAEAELERKRSLAAKDLVAPVAVQAALAAAAAARAKVEAQQATMARLAAEADGLRRGVFVSAASDDSSYSGQRRDEIRVKRAARKVEAAQAQIRVRELARQLATEEQQAARLSDAVLSAPVTGVVWQRFAAEGDAVRSGDPVAGVVDCDRLFLSAVLPKRYFSELRSGDRAKVRLNGGDGTSRAVVQSVRAAGSTQANGTAAVTPAAIEGEEVVVTLALRDDRVGNRSDNLCQVGQRATVTFDVAAFRPLVNSMAAAFVNGGNAS